MENASRLLIPVLAAVGDGDADALADLVRVLYGDLRQMAGRMMQGERAGHTLTPTALVHEAYLRLVKQTERNWENRKHFFAAAANVMRRVLVDHARKKRAAKRGRGEAHELLDGLLVDFEDRATDLLDLDAALEKLTALDERQSRFVELRFFGGLTVPEVAEVMGVSLSTVERSWRLARAWLLREVRSVAN